MRCWQGRRPRASAWGEAGFWRRTMIASVSNWCGPFRRHSRPAGQPPRRLPRCPCPVARAESRTVEAVVSAYNANIETLESCANRTLQEIRTLPTSEATP